MGNKATNMSATLYGTPGSRTQIVEWVALEFGVELDSVTLNQSTRSSPEYLAIHPFGKIPGCKAADGRTGIFESGAIMWPALEGSRGKCDMNALFGPVDDILGKQRWLLPGDDISVADMAVAAYVKYGQLFFRMNISSMPNLARFMKEVESRPAFNSTVAGG